MRGIHEGPLPAHDLLGRDEDLARLGGLLDADVPIVILGEAGVGKTSLVRAAIRATGRRAFEGGGFGTLAWVPLFAIERALGRPLPGADAAFAARELVRTVGDGILFVDDLHWVDEVSRAALSEVIGRLTVVIGVRAGDPATDAAIAMLPKSCVRMELETLDQTAAVALARRTAPGLDAPGARRIARRAGGNPLLISELARGGEEAPTLAAAIRIRLDTLDEAAREAMALLALAGHPMPAPALGPGAGRLASTGLAVVESDGRVRARHELIAAAAAQGIDEARRREMYARLARVSADPGEAARFHLAAGELDQARTSALVAAESAATPGEQATHLEVAALAAGGSDAIALRVRAADALLDAMEPERALAVLGEAAGSADASIALVETRARRAAYDLAGAREAVDRGLAAASADRPESEIVVRLQIEAARLVATEMGDRRAILDAAEAAWQLAARNGVALPVALAVLGEARIIFGDLAGLDDLAAALASASAIGDHGLGLSIGNRLVFGYLKAGQAADGRALADRLAIEARDLRLASWEDQMRFWASAFAWHGGDPAGAVAIVEARRETGGADDGEEWYGIQGLADLGRLDEARVWADRALARARDGEYDLGEALWVCADVAFMAGRHADAVAFAERHARDVPDAHHRMFVELPGAWATYELGRPAAWPQRRNVMPIDEGGAIELEALRAMAREAWTEAASQFEAAAEAWAGRHARGARRSQWAAGECRRRAGDVGEARNLLLRLEEELRAAGEVPILSRTQRSLRLAGIRRAAARRSVPGSTLTLREREILRLSGSGAPDAQIAARLGISRWAVIRSAESASAKLGASSRAEAVVAALAS